MAIESRTRNAELRRKGRRHLPYSLYNLLYDMRLYLSFIALICSLLALAGCGSAPEKPLKIGDLAPLFEAEDITGNPVQLSAYQNNPVVLRFFLPDCKYCRADTAVFNDYYSEFKDKGLMVVYINTDPNPEEVKKFVDELHIVFPVVLDPQKKIAGKYRVQVVPQTIVLNPQHKIIGAILGGVSKAELDSLLADFLGENK